MGAGEEGSRRERKIAAVLVQRGIKKKGHQEKGASTQFF
jgi:hypothetical protein